MFLHQSARFKGIARANGAVDLPVHLGGFAQVDGALDGFEALVVHRRGDGLHEGGENGIAGGLGDDAVKEHVVDQVIGRVIHGGEHLGDLFGQRGVVLLLAAVGGQRGQTAFQNQSRLEHLPGLKAVQRAHKTDRGLAECGRAVGNEGSHAVAHLHHSHGHELTDAGAQAGAADFERARKLALRGNFVSGLQVAALDERADVVDHLHGPVGIGLVLFSARHIS